jgi:tRNA-guanine family transglycosylase
MPVATQASLKGLTPEQLAQIGCKLCLNNTYHLGLKPGQAVLEQVGGAHRLQGWDKNILTDSGGLVFYFYFYFYFYFRFGGHLASGTYDLSNK